MAQENLRWLETEISHAHGAEEDVHELHQTAQGQAIISNDTLHLMEFAKMGRIDRLIPMGCKQHNHSRSRLGALVTYLKTLSMEKYRAGGTRPSLSRFPASF
jgi:hypothetical protein